jgi:hypothetical protein
VLVKADDQPIESRFGEAVWLTDFITPENPDVVLKYQELTKGHTSVPDKTVALWEYVSRLPYKQEIWSTLRVDGRTMTQKDTWFYPAEVMQVRKSNCVNKTFLMTSLLKNVLPKEGDVYGVMGYVTMDGIGGHAWVQVNIGGQDYIIETTQPNLPAAFIPLEKADVYDSKLYFSDKTVYTVDRSISVAEILNAHFGLCAVEFLRLYLCERCLEL